jgi:ribose-phosphate pyrophosphokinase
MQLRFKDFFDIPSDHLYASPVFLDIFRNKSENLVVVSADIGGIKLARSYAKKLNTQLVVIDKRRPTQNKAEVMNIIGDVQGKDILLVDDLIDTAGTYVSAINALKGNGANNIFGAVTHAVLSGDAVEKIEKSDISKLYVSDSIPLPPDIKTTKIEVRTASGLLAEAIRRTHNHESISSLFDIDKS